MHTKAAEWFGEKGYFKEAVIEAMKAEEYKVAAKNIECSISHYLEEGKLSVGILSRGTAWLDTGTFESLLQASQFVEVVQNRQGLMIGCIEEVAYRKGWISKEQLHDIASPLLKSGYGDYLMRLSEHS